MPSQIDYRSTSQYPAAEVAAVMLDPEYIRARLERIGGPGAALLEHSGDAVSGGRYRLRHGIERSALPSFVASLVSGNLVIERAESLRPAGGGYDGDVDVRIPGTPASATGSLRLQDAAGGSELLVRAEVTVKVPFLGGKIESVIAEQVQNLLRAETAFTLDWMASHRA